MVKTNRTRRSLAAGLMTGLFALLLFGGAACKQAKQGFSDHKSPTRIKNDGSSQANWDIGEKIFDLLVDLIGRSHCGPQKVAVLKANRARVVKAVNTILDHDLRRKLTTALGNIFPLIDDGTIPRLTSDLIQLLEDLRKDTETLEALVKLASAARDRRDVLDKRDMLALAGRLLQFEQIRTLTTSFGQLVDNDAGGKLVNSALELVSDLLTERKSAGATRGAVPTGRPSTPTPAAGSTSAATTSSSSAATTTLAGSPALTSIPALANIVANNPAVASYLTANPQVLVGLAANSAAINTSFANNPNLATSIIASPSTVLPALASTSSSPVAPATSNPTNPGPVVAPAPTSSASTDKLTEFLLGVASLSGARKALGEPVYVPRLDAQGFPRVRRNPLDNKCYEPFVADRADGVKRDAAGDPVDSSGKKIEIRPFMDATPTVNVDTHRRPIVATVGKTYYEYYDAKTTNLSLILQVVAGFARKRVHKDLVLVATHALGSRVTVTDASGATYTAYPKRNPLTDVNYGLVELLKKTDLPKLLSAFSELLAKQQGKAETLLIKLGKALDIIKKFKKTTTAASPSTGSNMMEDMLVIADKIFRKDPSGASTGRILFKVLHDIGSRTTSLPRQLMYMFKYRKMVRGSNNRIDLARSLPVNWSRPETYTSGGQKVDNRSSMQQLAALIYNADQCKIPFVNKSLAQLQMELLADMSPSSADSLNQVIMKLLGIGSTSSNPLTSIGSSLMNAMCPGVVDNMKAMDALGASGALDAIIPITKAFKDRGQIRLFLDIMKIQHQHYASLRASEEMIVQILDSGLVETLLEVLAIATTIDVPGHPGDKVADVVADFLATAVDRSTMVIDPNGNAHATLLHLVLEPMKQMEKRVRGTPAEAALGNVTTSLLAALTETEKDTAGNLVLTNRFIVPLLSEVMKVIAEKVKDPSTRAKTLDDMQAGVEKLISSKHFAALLDLVAAFEKTPGSAALDAALLNLLVPNQDANKDLYGIVLKILCLKLQAHQGIQVDTRALDQVLYFVGKAIHPSKPLMKDLIKTLAGILKADVESILLQIIRNTLHQGATGREETPLETLMDVFDKMSAACGKKELTAQSLSDDTIKPIVDVLKAETPKIFNLVRNRRR